MTARPSDNIKPVYVLHGKDGHLRQEHRNRLVARIIGDADPQLCLRVFDADAELIQVLAELRTLPFLAPHRVVVVREGDSFVQKNREALEKYLDAPAENGTLILMVDSLNRQTRFAKKVAEVGETVECSSPEGGELISWIKKEASTFGKKIRPDAAAALAGTVGGDLSSLRSELEKLCSYTGDSDSISTEDVGAVVTGTVPPEAFAVTNAITAGDIKKAIEHLHAALTTRGAEFIVLGQLAWHVRRCLAVRQKLDAGSSMFDALKAANVWKDKDQFGALIQRRSLQKIQSDMRDILQADIGMKSGLDPRDSLQLLVVKLCA